MADAAEVISSLLFLPSKSLPSHLWRTAHASNPTNSTINTRTTLLLHVMLLLYCNSTVWYGRGATVIFDATHNGSEVPILTPKTVVERNRKRNLINCLTASFYFLCPIYSLRHSLNFEVSLPLCRNSDPRSQSRLLSPVYATVRVLHFYREKI